MTKPRMALLLIAALAATSAWASEYKPGEVIVKYRSGIVKTRSNMNMLYDAMGIKAVSRFKGMMKGFEHLAFDPKIKVADVIAGLQKSPFVEYAQPNYILRALPVETADQTIAKKFRVPCIFPGIPWPPGCDDNPEPEDRPAVQDPPAEVNPPVVDPDLSMTYGMGKIGAPEAWSIHNGSKDFIVAVIDTGIDYNHEDLSFNVWRNPNPTKGDVVGYDFIHDDGLPYDDNQHGTHTSGTVGAVGGNGVAISGVTQKVSIMGLKFLSGEGSGTTSDAIKAIDYAVANGAKVLSNSWGGKADEENSVLKEAIERAKAKDVLFIAAAGNDSTDNDGPNADYPGAFDNDNLISVAATDSNDGMASFSNYGKKSTHLGAPGVKVYSTVPGNKYASLSGTSMACPHVAGAAALLWSRNPSWDYKKVKEVLMKTVDPVASLEGKTITGGRLNVLKALRYTE